MTYKCKHFSIEELAPPELCEELHEDLIWAMFDENVLKFADWLKGFCGGASVTVNTWIWGGNLKQSGLRTKSSEYYSETSQHSKGCALDLKVEGWTAEALRQALRKHEEEVAPVPYITSVEDKVTWLHVDTKPTGKDKLYFFNP